MSSTPSPRRTPALVRLLRLPSVLTVPGDVLLGASWTCDGVIPPAAASRALSSCLLYLAGMSLNDWADRERDASERPQRPIPAGEIAPAAALACAIALTSGALAIARRTRGTPAAAMLAAAAWGYDLIAKDTPAGPWAMALVRALDVLAGAAQRRSIATPPAAIIGAHALLITRISAHEVAGADQALAREALAGTAAIVAASLATSTTAWREAQSATTLSLACLALYAASMGRAGAALMRKAQAPLVQRLVGTGVLANMPLQAALLAARGRRALPMALILGWPLARRAARRTAVT